MAAASWCVPCFESSHAHTPATRTHDEDPMCQACAVRLGFEEKAPAAKAPAAAVTSAATKSAEEPATAGEAIVPRFPGDSPLSRRLAELFPTKHPVFGGRIHKRKESSGMAHFDLEKFKALIAQKKFSMAEIADKLGFSLSAMKYHIKAAKNAGTLEVPVCSAPGCSREIRLDNKTGLCRTDAYIAANAAAGKKQSARKTNAPKRPDGGATVLEPSGALTVALPESALDAFFAKLPAERKIAIFTSELAR